ncbi:MAG: roadblock/LC7 domain-containing protein [Planctomycetota bacterium]|jgi:predicted regulator of Ras-like GTPase activity (Roadblock/LC7/MglB family)
MLEILRRLNTGVGVRGSMIVTSEGIVVAADLGGELEEERVAAMASSVIQETQRCMNKVNLETFTEFILTSVHGKMVFHDIGIAFLVVLTDKGINLDHTLIEIRGAAFKIKSRAKLGE